MAVCEPFPRVSSYVCVGEVLNRMWCIRYDTVGLHLFKQFFNLHKALKKAFAFSELFWHGWWLAGRHYESKTLSQFSYYN